MIFDWAPRGTEIRYVPANTGIVLLERTKVLRYPCFIECAQIVGKWITGTILTFAFRNRDFTGIGVVYSQNIFLAVFKIKVCDFE